MMCKWGSHSLLSSPTRIFCGKLYLVLWCLYNSELCWVQSFSAATPNRHKGIALLSDWFNAGFALLVVARLMPNKGRQLYSGLIASSTIICAYYNAPAPHSKFCWPTITPEACYVNLMTYSVCNHSTSNLFAQSQSSTLTQIPINRESELQLC